MKMTKPDLVKLLSMVQTGVRMSDSLEGTLTYQANADGRTFEVTASIRTDAALGQGRTLMLGPSDQPNQPAFSHDETKEAWAILYEDPDHAPEVFIGAGAAAAARARYDEANQAWNCWLLASIVGPK